MEDVAEIKVNNGEQKEMDLESMINALAQGTEVVFPPIKEGEHKITSAEQVLAEYWKSIMPPGVDELICKAPNGNKFIMQYKEINQKGDPVIRVGESAEQHEDDSKYFMIRSQAKGQTAEIISIEDHIQKRIGHKPAESWSITKTIGTDFYAEDYRVIGSNLATPILVKEAAMNLLAVSELQKARAAQAPSVPQVQERIAA